MRSNLFTKILLPFLTVFFFVFISACGSDTVTNNTNNSTILFSDDFSSSFPGTKWTKTGNVSIDSTFGFIAPSLNCNNGSVSSIGTISTDKNITLNVAYVRLDTSSMSPATISLLDNGFQYIAVSIFKNNINIYVNSPYTSQAFPFQNDSDFHTFSDKITTDGKNNFYRDNVLFFNYTIPNTHLLSISLNSPNLNARFDNIFISTP